MNSEKVQKAAEFWDSNYKIEVPEGYWTCHPIINEYVNSIIAHDATNILEWFAKNFVEVAPFERGLSIGCGTGNAEREAIEAGICHCMDGYDISAASIEVARQEAEKAGMGNKLTYKVVDMNSLEIPQGYYDFVVCIGSLHHVEDLEGLFKELKNGLKKNAFLFINEYVGPSRLQWTEKQLKILNKVWEIMPPEYRKPGPLESVIEEELIKTDPSEAIRSSEIIPLLCEHFEVVDYIEYGGSFLMPFWFQGIMPKIFLEESNIDRQVIIKLLCLFDELVREEKILPNCYAQIVARNSPPVRDRPLIHKLQTTNRKRWTDIWALPDETVRQLREKLDERNIRVLELESAVNRITSTRGWRLLEKLRRQRDRVLSFVGKK